MKNGKSQMLILLALIILSFVVRESFAQYVRYTSRPVATSNCATGNCPAQNRTNATPAQKEIPKEATPEKETDGQETRLVDPIPEEPTNVSEKEGNGPCVNQDEEWATPNMSADAETNDGLGSITLIYPSTAQSNDEVVAYASRRARELVAEDYDPIDSETPIGSIRTVGARLRELTSAIEEQQKKIDLISGNDGEYAMIIDSIKKLRENDESFQKDAREGLASVLEAVKKQNESFIAERVKDAVTPAPASVGKWVVIALVGLTILVIWFILIVKIIGWFINLGKSSIAKVVESAVSSVRSIKNDSNSPDEIKL